MLILSGIRSCASRIISARAQQILSETTLWCSSNLCQKRSCVYIQLHDTIISSKRARKYERCN